MGESQNTLDADRIAPLQAALQMLGKLPGKPAGGASRRTALSSTRKSGGTLAREVH
jgi:hypothetical protein